MRLVIGSTLVQSTVAGPIAIDGRSHGSAPDVVAD
jgi:hypothetical protein